MMVMGYFRSSTKSALPSAAAGGKNKKKAKNSCAPAAHEEAGLREALLDQPAESAAADGGVPKGYFEVYAGEESRRFVVPTGYLREPAFRDLMERVPCAEEDFEDLLRRLHRKNGHSGGAAGKGKKAVVVGR